MTFEQRTNSRAVKGNRINEHKQRYAKEHKSVIEVNEMKENFEFNIKGNTKTSKNCDLHNENKHIHNLKKNIEEAINKHHASLEENDKNLVICERKRSEHIASKINQKIQKSIRGDQNPHTNKSIREIRDSPNLRIKPFELEESTTDIADYDNMLNVLNVSGIDRDDSKDFRVGNINDNEYIKNGIVNDQIINDIQRRLELLTRSYIPLNEFK